MFLNINVSLLENTGMFIGARWKEENNNNTDEFYWITTGASMTFTCWKPGYPKSNTNKQCVIVKISDGIPKWENGPCRFNKYALCKM